MSTLPSQNQSAVSMCSNAPRFRIVFDPILKRLAGIRSSQFNKNMGAGSVMALIGTCLSIVSYPIYLHYLGYHDYGLWLVLSVVVSLAQLGNLGIPWALMKLVAEDHGRGDWAGVKSYLNIGCGIILAVGAVFFIVVMLIRPYLLSWFRLGGEDASVVYSLLPYVAALSVLVLLFSVFNASLGGLGRIDLTSYNEALVQISIIAICALLLYLGLGLRAMVIGTLAGYLLAQVVSLVQVQRILPISLLGTTRIDRQKVQRLLGTGGWILGGGIFSMMLLPLTRLMLSRYAGLEAVAVNDMCWTGSLRVRSIFDFAFRPVMPEVSSHQLNGTTDMSALVRSIDRKSFLIISVAALPLFIGLILAMNPLLHLWLHKSFNPLLPSTFRVALIGAFLSLLGSSAYYLLIGLGKARDAAFSTAIQFTANAVVLVTLALNTQHLTVVEAATAFGISTALSTLYLRIRIHFLIKSQRNRSSLIISPIDDMAGN